MKTKPIMIHTQQELQAKEEQKPLALSWEVALALFLDLISFGMSHPL